MAIYLGSNQVDLGLYNIQSDWAETDTTKESYIQNKPSIFPAVELTQSQYDALSTAEKNNGNVYYVTDSTGTYLTASEVSYGSSSVQNALDNLSYIKVIEMAAFSSLPQTVTNASISEDHVCIKAELGTPSAQTGDWTVTTSNGSLTLSGSISGSTTAKLYLAIQE